MSFMLSECIWVVTWKETGINKHLGSSIPLNQMIASNFPLIQRILSALYAP